MTKKNRIRVGIVVSIICIMSFSDWGFAAEKTEVEAIAWIVNVIVNILSWGWVLLAKLAGEFLTNKWVYGEWLGLDSLLWQYRNVLKNIANFCLGFYFVYIIFAGLIDKSNSVESIIKHKILGILLAGIGIQASWFFTAAMVDVSTITLVAAGSLPAQLIAGNEKIQRSYEINLSEYFDEGFQNVIYGKYISLFDPDSESGKFIKSNNIPLKKPQEKKEFFDELSPRPDNIAGPLYYLGFSVLNANEVGALNSFSKDSIKGAILNLIIMGGTTVIYAVEMVVLCILALMRIIYLWMFIVLSPLVIFLWCLKMSKDDKVLKLSFVEKLMKQVNLKSFFLNIFKPTIIVIGLSLVTLFASLMKGVLIENADRNIDLGGITVETKKINTDNSSEDKLFTSTMDGGIIKFTIGYVGKGLLDFIMSIITVILVYIIIKFAVKFGEGTDFVSDKIKSVQKTAGGLFTSLPVMPVTGYDKEGVETTRFMNMKQVFGVDEDLRSNGTGGIIGARIGKYNEGIRDKYNEQNNIIDSWLGNETGGDLSSSERQQIQTAIGKRDNRITMDHLINVKSSIPKTKEGKRMTLDESSDSSKFWVNEFTSWLTNVDKTTLGGDWKKMKDNRNNGKDSEGNDRTLESLFTNDSRFVSAYAQFFFDESDPTRYGINSWNDLKKADISKAAEEKQ